MNELSARLLALAKAGETMTYGALARSLQLSMAELTSQLEQTMEVDHARCAPLRAALLEARMTPGLPARGFFLKAADLGYETHDQLSFIQAQRRDLHLLATGALRPRAP